MKKILVVAVVCTMVVLAAGSAFAAGQAHQNAGCGLGTMLFKNQADDSALLQSVQVTINGTFFNTFAITTGTSDCDKPRNFVSNERLNEFVVANMDNLARDIAQGRGETLDAFADLQQVPAEKRPEFYSQLQSGFSRIFTSPNVQMASVIDNISIVTQ